MKIRKQSLIVLDLKNARQFRDAQVAGSFLSLLTTVNLREWQDKETSDEIGDKVSDRLADESAVHMCEE